MSAVVPKGFISHASEDKDRFVVDFAGKLRAQGIDAWLDKWEMLPGDRVIGKIFDEGIGNAKFIIVVLSNSSVSKPWVRAELEVAVVKKIDEGMRIIPVVIDENCEVPEPLKSDLRVRIADLKDYESELKRIVSAIYGVYDRPPLGPPPTYVSSIASVIPGLEKTDTLILKLICEEASKSKDSGDTFIHTEQLWEQVATYEIDIQDFVDSLEELKERHYIKATMANTGRDWQFPFFKVTTTGYETYANQFVSDYHNIFMSVIGRIVNDKDDKNFSIADALGQPIVLVNHILDVLALRAMLKVSKPINTDAIYSIFNVSPRLKRLLKT